MRNNLIDETLDKLEFDQIWQEILMWRWLENIQYEVIIIRYIMQEEEKKNQYLNLNI